MSKTTQANPAVENSAEEKVSNTSKPASNTAKRNNTAPKAALILQKRHVLVQRLHLHVALVIRALLQQPHLHLLIM